MNIRRSLVILFFAFASANAFGQPGGGDPGGGGKPGVPISGIEWLLLGGGLLGARKMISRISKSKSVD